MRLATLPALALLAAACAHPPAAGPGLRLALLHTGDGRGEVGPCG